MKKCNKCGEDKTYDNFYVHKRNKDGYCHTCKDCVNKLRRDNEKSKREGTFESKCRKPRLSEDDHTRRQEERLEYFRQHRLENFDHIKIVKKRYSDSLKTDGIRAYGGKCTCCGESIEDFLTIEHLNGRNKDEKRHTGKRMWAKAKSEGYPDTYTVLCFNCNCAKGAFGICPHQKLKEV